MLLARRLGRRGVPEPLVEASDVAGGAGGDRPSRHAAVEALRSAAELDTQQLSGPADGDKRLQATACAGGVDTAAWRPAGVADVDAQHAGGRVRTNPLRCRQPVATVLGQLADVADRKAGKIRDALHADSGGPQTGDVLADRSGVDVGMPASVDPFSGDGAAGGGVGGGAVGTAAAVLDVGGAGAVPVAGLRMGALPLHSCLATFGSAAGLLAAAPVLRTRVAGMVRVGPGGGGVVGGVAADRAGVADPHRRTGCRGGPGLG